jgi:hypothetical protein
MGNQGDNNTKLLCSASYILLFDFAFKSVELEVAVEEKIRKLRDSFPYKLDDIKRMWKSQNEEISVNFMLLYEGVSRHRGTDFEFSRPELDQFHITMNQIQPEMNNAEAIRIIHQFL